MLLSSLTIYTKAFEKDRHQKVYPERLVILSYDNAIKIPRVSYDDQWFIVVELHIVSQFPMNLLYNSCNNLKNGATTA
jgi:hypothetical protein